MDIDLTIYQGEDQFHFGEFALSPVLRHAALLCFGDRARRGQIEFQLEESEDDRPWTGPPQVRNLTDRFARCSIRLLNDGETLAVERMRVVDLFGPVLAPELAQLQPEETHWAFRLRKRRVATLLQVAEVLAERLLSNERPAPEAEGSVDVDPGERRHRPFTLTPMAATDAELVQPSTLGLDPERLGRLNILMSKDIHDEFLRRMPLSNRMEEGGFLLGRISKAADDVHLVQITHITPAHRSGAGVIHFTFTGDSFLAAAQLIEDRGEDEQLVGWYHTHLFGLDFSMGLSSIDVDLHLATFQRPWQVAALINIRRRDRVLRFYGRDEKTLREYDQWISDDRTSYRPAPRPMGDD
ncbi:hypothetical protein Daura_39855 [Dactylosporangium aurantiacum]|uniref:JAB-N domain-containing protein n=1 Tax=Dactylosporangium aurantiacum TaxID=35754 RepID=A0A9Q9IB15_9ACTN|nr:JAB N-terminal domain-containing protein [Dactylosporangium aurantiacum]MDG6101419.1 hypothetical protein [Dactylosporangium aurantiacum]UWZ52727.1 hypothetical protein Daura_39855 [Dactylosporangium aurantiacum]